MSDFVYNSVHTAQLVYDLMPLAASISDDPYLHLFDQGKEFIANYKYMVEKTHSDLIR